MIVLLKKYSTNIKAGAYGEVNKANDVVDGSGLKRANKTNKDVYPASRVTLI